MLIFTLPSWYKSKKYPEASIFIYEQMKALIETGDKVVVLAVEPISIKSAEKPHRDIIFEDDNGVLTYRTEIKPLYPSKLRAQYIYVFRKALKRMLDIAIKEHGKPDVLYAHFSYPAGAIAVDFAKEYNIPLVVEEHYSGLMENHIDKALLKCVEKAVNGSNTFIAVSAGLKQSIEKKLGKQTDIKVISNMINDAFQYSEPIVHDEFTFFACGSLIPRKGFTELINAFEKEFKDENNIVLRIGGSGEQRDRLLELIARLNMSSRIKLTGQLSREDTIREYMNCDCFVLPSKAETYGLVYREALAVGRPIISTMHGGFGDDDWHDEYGKLIPVDDENALRAAMRQVYQNYKDYDLRRISRLCLQDCSSSSVAGKIHTILLAASKGISEMQEL